MRLRNNFTVLLIFLSAALVLYLSFGRILIYAIAKINNLDISYKGLKTASLSRFEFKGLKIIDNGRGAGFLSEHARVEPKWKKIFPVNIAIDFDMKDVRFIRKEGQVEETYDTLSGLVGVPFTSRWTYKEISGRIERLEKGVHIQDFSAVSDEIKLLLNGDIYNDNTAKSDIRIYFCEELVRKIPEVLSNVVLQDEEGGWRSLSVNLSGNYKTPAIQVSGKLFRLNIRGSPSEKP